MSKFEDVPAAWVGTPDPTILLLANDAAAAAEPCPWRRGKRSNCCLAACNIYKKYTYFFIYKNKTIYLIILKYNFVVSTKHKCYYCYSIP